MKNFKVITVMFLISLLAVSLQAASLKLDKSNFAPGESIHVHFKAPADLADNAWIGIIPSHIKHGSEAENDKHDVAYQYLKKRTSGTLVFKAPTKLGKYDFRMNSSDSSGKELTYTSFTVGKTKAKLILKSKQVSPNTDITVWFEVGAGLPDSAWIGLIPSSVPHGSEPENDKHDLAFKYLKKQTKGAFVFKTPATNGSYDFRLNSSDSNGVELASVTFHVGAKAVYLRLDQHTFEPGAQITVYFKAPANLPDNAWVGLIPANVKHGSEAENDKHDLAYQYLKKRAKGSLTFKAPTNPGSYDFRMNSSDSNGKELTYVTFNVR